MAVRLLIAAVLSAAACLLSVPAAAQQKTEALRDGVVDQAVSDISLSAFEVEQIDGKSVATFEYSHPGDAGAASRYLRLVIDELVLGEGDQLTLEGVNLSSRGALNGQVFKGPVDIMKPFLTDLVYGSSLKLTLISPRMDAARLHIPQFIYEEVPPDPQLSIFDHDDRLNFTKVDNPSLQSVGKSVIFLAYMDGETPRVCSGFVINQTMVMTNDHCVNTAEKCASATIVFDYLDTDGVVTMGEQRRCAAVRDALEGLDFAVLELDHPVPGVTPIALRETDIAVGLQTYLIQHPGGEHKQLAAVGCQVIDPEVTGLDPAEQTDFTHRCDTIGGSSGSPVVVAEGNDGKFCVTGLHHLGFASDGDFDTKNRAVRISLIAKRLKERSIQYAACGG